MNILYPSHLSIKFLSSHVRARSQMESSNQRNSSGISATLVKDLFDGTGNHFSAAEIEFIAENCLVSIKPRRKLEEIDLLSVIETSLMDSSY